MVVQFRIWYHHHRMYHHSGLRRSIFLKLAILFLALVSVLLSITGAMNTDGARTVEREIRQSVQSRIRFYLTNIEQEIGRIENLERQYVVDQELTLLSVDAQTMTAYERLETILNLQQRLAILEASSNYVQEAFIAIRPIDRIIVNDDFLTGVDDAFYQSLIEPVDGTSLVVSGEEVYVAQRYPAVSDPSVESLYVVAARISNEHVRTVLHQVLGMHIGQVALSIGDGVWRVGRGTLEELSPDDQLLRFSQRSDSLPIVIDVELSAADALGSLGAYQRWFWFAVGASALSIGAFVLLSFRIVHRPLHLLVEAFQELQSGNLDIQLGEHRRDEFEYLYESFNATTCRLRELIRSVYEQEILRQRSELKRLQSQINPHFLYNNFFVLYRMIKAGRTKDAATLASYMGTYFQFVTRDGRNEDTLAEEVSHARTYSSIQSLSYGQRIAVDFPDPPGELAELMVPRLILQPILENAYEHALERKVARAELRVSYQTTDRALQICVDDNGEAISQAEIDSLNRGLVVAGSSSVLEGSIGTGLSNVHQRLVLRFGEAAGLTLSRSPRGGLRVRLVVPTSSPEVLTTDEASRR